MAGNPPVGSSPLATAKAPSIRALQCPKCAGRLEVRGLGLSEPPAPRIVEQQMPLVPEPVLVSELDAADHGEMHRLKPTLNAQLKRRPVHLQFRHAAEILDVHILAEDRRTAVRADGQYRDWRLEVARRAAVGTREAAAHGVGTPGPESVWGGTSPVAPA